MNNALRNSIARPSLRAAVNSQDLVIDSGAASSLRPVQPGHCLNLVSASSQYVDSGLTVTGGAAIDVSFTINPDSTFNGLLGCGGDVNTNKGFLLNQVAGNIAISSADGTTLFGSSFTGLTISSGAWYECRLVWDGGTSTPTLTVNGVDYVTAGTISGWAGASGENLKFGDAAGAYFDGQLGFCKHAGFLQYNNDFSTGTSAIDSSGNNNDGTLVNGPTWTTSDTLPYSWLNQAGYGGSSRVVWSGGAGWDDGCYSEESAAGDFVVRMPITEAAVNQFLGVNSDPTTTGGFTTLDNALLMTSSFTLAAYESGVSKLSTSFIIGDVVEIIRVGTTITYLKNSVVFYTSLVSSTAILYVDTAFNGDGSNVSNVTLDGVYLTWVDVPNCTVSNIYIPRDEATPANDAFGNPLQWSGSAFPRRPVYRDSYGISPDGSNDYATTGIIPAASGSIEVTFRKGTSTNKFLFGARDSANTRAYVGYDSAKKPTGGVGAQSGLTIIGTTIMAVGAVYKTMLSWTGSVVTLNIDDVTEYTGAQSGVVGTVQDMYIGTFNDAGTPFATGYVNDEIFEIKVNGVTRYTCADGVGDTIHDVLGTHDATAVNASTATEGTGFWAGRIDGEANAHNINNGFSLYESGANDLRVPYVSGAAHPSPTVPGGYTLTSQNPAVANSHNDAETTWDFENIGTGDTIAPETDHFANFDAVTFSDTNYSLGITSPIDSVFWRDISTVLKDRATGYGATLTGAGLVYANNYTDGERWNNLAPWDDDNIWND